MVAEECGDWVEWKNERWGRSGGERDRDSPLVMQLPSTRPCFPRVPAPPQAPQASLRAFEGQYPNGNKPFFWLFYFLLEGQGKATIAEGIQHSLNKEGRATDNHSSDTDGLVSCKQVFAMLLKNSLTLGSVYGFSFPGSWSPRMPSLPDRPVVIGQSFPLTVLEG